MPLELIPSLLFAILVVGYSPGPANIYAMACCLKYGRRKALRVWRGQLVGFLIMAIVTVLAIHLLGELIGRWVIYLKYAGAVYLLWLAIRMLRTAGQVPESGPGKGKDDECNFVSGMVVQLTNAKMILFEITVYSAYVLPYSNRLTDLLPVTLVLPIAGPGANLLYLYAGAYLRRFLSRYRKRVDIVMAALLLLCAVYLFFI